MDPELDKLTRAVAEKQRIHSEAFHQLDTRGRMNIADSERERLWIDWIQASRDIEAASKTLRTRALDVFNYPADHPLRRLGI